MAKNVIQDGSIRALWKVSSSLMVSFFSMVAMVFFDRLFLSYYSPSALNAAASAGTLFWAGCFSFVTLATMAEVFVAQYNGAKQHTRLGEPVWQMLWLSLFSVFIFCFLATTGSGLLLKQGIMNTDEAYYFRWNNFIAPAFVFLAALSAFFIGQGKTRIIKWLAILGNLVNIALDPLFIFGYKGWIPSMGIKGAAIATGLGVMAQVTILAIVFLKPKNQIEFGTLNWHFKSKPFWKCIKVGFPPAIFVMFELAGWGMFYMMMERISMKHIHVTSITQSVLILLFFFGFAMEKGAAAVAGNLIGAKLLYEVKRLVKSGVLLTLVFTGLTAVALIGFPDIFIHWFFQNPPDVSPEMLAEIKGSIKIGLGFLVVYLAFENLRLMINGVLTSAGDTLFLMIAGALSIWLFMLIPTYFLMLKRQGPVEITFYIWLFYSGISTCIMFSRFAWGKWKNKHLIDDSSDIGELELASVHSTGNVSD